jgi:dolichyl-phosphate beta-glucosyltransferase
MTLAKSLKVYHLEDRGSDPERIDHDLSLVIPAYNEESRLPRTLSEIKTYLDQWGINYRVIVVDDGSRDSTPTLTNEYGRRFSTVQQPNGGKGSAVRNGMLKANGRIVAFTDADLPYDLDALKAAYDLIDRGSREVVFGSRTMRGAESHVERRWLRTVASTVFRSLMRVLVSNKVSDTQCGLKVFSRSAARRIFSQTTIDGFAFDAEVIYLTHQLKLSFQTIPVTLINEYSSTISLLHNALPMLLDVLKVRWHAIRGGYNLRDAGVSNTADQTTIKKAA